jgi:hypothetical protein
LEPRTPTRSPNQISVLNGFISPVSSSFEATTARFAVRPPRSRIDTFCSIGRASGGPASRNFASRVWAAW